MTLRRIFWVVFVAALTQLVPPTATAQSGLSPTGTVVVTPTGLAVVYLDANKVRTARPGEAVSIPRVEIGRHIVEVRGSGFENFLVAITVQAGQTSAVPAVLVTKTGEIKFNQPTKRDYKDPLVEYSSANKDVLRRAATLTRNQEYAAARSLIQPLLKKDDSDPIASYYLAATYLDEAQNCGCDEQEAQVKYLATALPLLEKGANRGRPFVYSLIGMARYHAVQKNFDKVKEYNIRAQEFNGEDVEVLAAIADAYLATRSRAGIDEATTVLSKAETINGNVASVQVALGDAWLMQGVQDIALQKYQRAVAIDPMQVSARYRLGQFYREQRKYQDAATELKKAIEIDPKFAPAYTELGEVWFRAKQYGAAKENYRKYVELKGNDRQARYRYAQFLYLAQDYPGAVAEIKALQKDTTTNLLYRLLAYSSFESGNVAEAKQALTTYFAGVKPEFTIARDYEYRGKIALKEGRSTEGLADIEKALEMDPTRDDLFAEAIRACMTMKNQPRALGFARKAVALEPSYQNYYMLGKTIQQQPRSTSEDTIRIATMADSAFAKLCELRPNVMTGPLERARNAFSLDPETEKGTAKPYYEQILAIAEKDPTRYRKELLESYQYLAYCYHNALKDDTKALEYWDKLFAIDPPAPDSKIKELADYVRNRKK